MPKYNNCFASPAYIEETICDEDGKVIGKLRIKPSGVLWKPSNARQYYSVPLETFTAWITDKTTAANRVAQ